MYVPCRFMTNIDCMKKFMPNISGLPINPAVGDLVRVYKDSELEVYLRVESRSWTFVNGAEPELTCDLHLAPGWTLPQFIETMYKHNIR